MFNTSSFDLLFQNLTMLAVSKKYRLLIGYSGGVDSHVLLDICKTLRQKHPKIKLGAIHINHCINESSQLWAKHCEKICSDTKIDFIVKKINAKILPKSGHSQEEIARELRYKAFAEILKTSDCLLTAHHADDQAETLLLQLFRGAGPKGLSAMPHIAPLGKGLHIRPFLNFSREEIELYARNKNLTWVEDESNVQLEINRNYIRRNLMPIIKKRWPGILVTISRTAKLCAECDELLAELGAADCKIVAGSKINTLSRNKLLLLEDSRQRNALRYWLHSQKMATPSSAKLRQLQKDILRSRHDSAPLIHWRGVEVRRFGDDIYAMPPLKKIKPNLKLRWQNLNEPLILPSGLGVLYCDSNLSKNMLSKLGDEITISFRTGGERCKLANRQGSRELKKLFQEWHIPPWQRGRIPLIYYRNELIAVAGCAICESTLMKRIKFVLKPIEN